MSINASVVQGSALGPATYIINAIDLKVVTPGNKLHKYADDTYLLVPSCNKDSIELELQHITVWAQENNLNLNKKKSLEMVVCNRKNTSLANPPPTSGVDRVPSLNILGVNIGRTLSVAKHVNNLVNG